MSDIWERHISTTYFREYWFNPSDGTTTWDNPFATNKKARIEEEEEEEKKEEEKKKEEEGKKEEEKEEKQEEGDEIEAEIVLTFDMTKKKKDKTKKKKEEGKKKKDNKQTNC